MRNDVQRPRPEQLRAPHLLLLGHRAQLLPVPGHFQSSGRLTRATPGAEWLQAGIDARAFPRCRRRTCGSRVLQPLMQHLLRQARAEFEGLTHDGRPTLSVLCVHNAGRSQPAKG
jgi:hypothetical protein